MSFVQSKSVLVSVASRGRENYIKAQLNLIKSAKNAGWGGEYLMRAVDGDADNYLGVPITLGSWPVTEKYGVSWQHKDMPYQFKPFAIWEAIEAGYTKILWCDSTVRLVKNPDPLWEKCAERGVLAWNNEGHPLIPYTPLFMEKWLADQYYSIDGEKQIMACCIMFDTAHPHTLPIMKAWIKGAVENCFHNHDEEQREGFKVSRHDQALLSHLLHHYKIPISDYGELAYRHYLPIEPTFINWGVI